jgi:hypothetical protein
MSRQVIARVHPISLGVLLLGALLLTGFFMADLQANGWTNPHAFQCLSRRCQNSFMAQLPYAAQSGAIFFGAVLLFLTVQFVALALYRFDDVILDDGHLTHASHPWLGRFNQADLRFVEPLRLTTGDWPTIRVGCLNIAYRVKGVERGVTLMTWLYRESEDTILANFEAAGFEVRRPGGDKTSSPPPSDKGHAADG